MDYSYPRNLSYTVPMFGRGQAVARRRYMVRNEKNNFAALPSNTYSDSESRRVKRFLNSFHSPNSEFFEVKTQFQTGGVSFENGPPFFAPSRFFQSESVCTASTKNWRLQKYLHIKITLLTNRNVMAYNKYS